MAVIAGIGWLILLTAGVFVVYMLAQVALLVWIKISGWLR